MHTILLIEDDRSLRDLLERVLAPEYNVLAVADGHEALNEFRNNVGEIDLVLIDVGLPYVNGWDLAGMFDAVRPGIKCLMTSGNFNSCPSNDPSPTSKLWFLPKPFSIGELLSMVKEVFAFPTVIAPKTPASVKDFRIPGTTAEG